MSAEKMWRKLHSPRVTRSRLYKRNPKHMSHMIKTETSTSKGGAKKEIAEIDLEDDEEEIRKIREALRKNRENPVFCRIDLRAWATAEPEADFKQFTTPVIIAGKPQQDQ